MRVVHYKLDEFVQLATEQGWRYLIRCKPDPNCAVCGGRGWNDSRFSQYEPPQTVDCSCVIVAEG